MIRELLLIWFGWTLGRHRSVYGALGSLFILGLVIYTGLAILVAIMFMVGLLLFPLRIILRILSK